MEGKVTINAVEMAEQLKGRYREVFERADLYGTLNGFEQEVLEDKLMNLYDLLMEAQHEEKYPIYRTPEFS